MYTVLCDFECNVPFCFLRLVPVPLLGALGHPLFDNTICLMFLMDRNHDPNRSLSTFASPNGSMVNACYLQNTDPSHSPVAQCLQRVTALHYNRPFLASYVSSDGIPKEMNFELMDLGLSHLTG